MRSEAEQGHIIRTLHYNLGRDRLRFARYEQDGETAKAAREKTLYLGTLAHWFREAVDNGDRLILAYINAVSVGAVPDDSPLIPKE